MPVELITIEVKDLPNISQPVMLVGVDGNAVTGLSSFAAIRASILGTLESNTTDLAARTTIEGSYITTLTLNQGLETKAALSHQHTFADIPAMAGVLSDITDLESALTGKAPSVHYHAIGDITGLQSALDAKIDSTKIGAVNGVAGLNSNQEVPLANLPAAVKNVGQYATFGDFPATGDTNRIYIDLAGPASYYWDGDSYELLAGTPPAPSTTDTVTEGSTNLYFTAARVRAVALTGLSLVTNAAITATDTILEALSKLQVQISAHLVNTSNPHSVTKTQVGLSNVDNTADADKPISTATATALSGKTATSRSISAAGLATGGGDFTADRTITVPKATSTDVRTGTDDTKALTAKSIVDAMDWVTVAYSATITIDHAAGTNFVIGPLTGAPAIAAPINPKKGYPLTLRIQQDATGSRVPTWNGVFDFGDLSAPTLSTTANAEDTITFLCISATKFLYTGIRKRSD